MSAALANCPASRFRIGQRLIQRIDAVRRPMAMALSGAKPLIPPRGNLPAQLTAPKQNSRRPVQASRNAHACNTCLLASPRGRGRHIAHQIPLARVPPPGP